MSAMLPGKPAFYHTPIPVVADTGLPSIEKAGQVPGVRIGVA